MYAVLVTISELQNVSLNISYLELEFWNYLGMFSAYQLGMWKGKNVTDCASWESTDSSEKFWGSSEIHLFFPICFLSVKKKRKKKRKEKKQNKKVILMQKNDCLWFDEFPFPLSFISLH